MARMSRTSSLANGPPGEPVAVRFPTEAVLSCQRMLSSCTAASSRVESSPLIQTRNLSLWR